ncbi:MAG: FAD:protein FMN transferase [Planctomycetes bacterium]|nr:FAD:protein FMN transferase [Planctomycetota bacterium]
MATSVVRLARALMATRFEIVLCGEDSARLRSIGEEALDEIARLDAQLSLFSPSSEISHINARAAFEAVPVEPRLFALLERAERLRVETDGAFDVALGRLVDAWGIYDGVTKANRARASGAVNEDALILDSRDRTVRFARDGVALDFGAIGKGFAIDAAAAIVRNRGVTRALLHGGKSTIHAIGAWPIGLADPRDASRRVGRLVLEDRSLSTSSAWGRYVVDGGEMRGHVLDPRSGAPVAGRVAAWAIAPFSTDSDALSTAFYVLGAEGMRRCCERLRGVGGIVMTERRFVACHADVERVRESTGEPQPCVSRRSFLKGAAAAAAAFSIGLPAIANAMPQAGDKKATLRCALAGAGDQGRLLLSQLARMKEVKVTAIAEPWKSHRDKALEIAGRSVETYDDVTHLLKEETDTDALIVAAPTYLHATIAVAALRAGKHVFCEAPMSHTIDDAKAIVRAARAAASCVFQMGYQRRSSKLFPHALTHVECGAIGDLTQVRAQWHKKQSWRRVVDDPKNEKLVNWRLYQATSGGLLVEQSSHAIDLANWYFGDVPASVSGLGSLLQWKDGREVHDSVQALLEYPGGKQVAVSATLGNSYGDEWELLIGTEGAILLLGQGKGLLFKEPDSVAAGWEQYAKKEMLGEFRGIVLDADATKYASHDKPEKLPDAGTADTFAELEDFFAAIRDKKPRGADAEAGLHAVVPCIVAAEAIEKRATIALTKDHYGV